MIYFFVHWIHNFVEEPVYLYHEINEDRREQRKVWIWKDGRIQFADVNHQCGSTELSWEILPSVDEISADPQFVVKTLTEREFSEVWETALQRGNQPPCL